ncbi:MAG: hypothetical protein M3Z33_02820, partial [Actinomycetota bacterium]|nr:hypothetical protein [Actinomycetota bacterium]
MVKLKNHRISFSAVDAWVDLEELDEESRALEGQLALPGTGLVDVALAIRCVVLLLVGSAARPAEAVSLAMRLSTPRELLGRLQFTASVTSLDW